MTDNQRKLATYRASNLEAARIIAADRDKYPEGSLMAIWAQLVLDRAEKTTMDAANTKLTTHLTPENAARFGILTAQRLMAAANSESTTNLTPETAADINRQVDTTRAFVSDSTSTTFNVVPGGLGGVHVPVFFDGAQWRVG